MNELLFYVIVFVAIYLCHVLFVIGRKKKLEKFKNNTYIKYLEKVYDLELSKANSKVLAHIVSLANAGIITVTLAIIGITNNLFYKMLLAISVLIPFQLLIYHIIGKCYQFRFRKGNASCINSKK